MDSRTKTILAIIGFVVIGISSLLVASGLPQGRQMGMSDAAIEKVVHDYLLKHPEILVEASNKYNEQKAAQEAAARDKALAAVGVAALFDPKIAFVNGPADAKISVAEFFDYRCTYCKASLPAVQKLIAQHKDLRFAFIEHPILTKDSEVAAHASAAARKQNKYLEFHYALLQANGDLPLERILDIAKSVGLDTGQLQKDMNDPEIIKSVKDGNAIADKIKVDGTPTFIINGKVYAGGMDDAAFAKAIAETKS
jgi:protein-disulfide isomerase